MIRPTFALVAVLALGSPAPGQAPPSTSAHSTATAERVEARVVRVVDGDTIVVELAGKPTTIRLLGVDAPESVEPGKSVEPGAKEAAAFLRSRVEGKTVALGFQPASRRTDSRGRTLAWVDAPDGRQVNIELVERGYARVYSSKIAPAPERFRKAEAGARSARLGIWSTEPIAAEAPAPAPATAGEAGPATVYVTDRGEKYHRSGCQYLAKSSHPHALAEVPARYTPCSRCDPPERPSKGR